MTARDDVAVMAADAPWSAVATITASTRTVVVHAAGVSLPPEVVARLAEATEADGVASASPVPVDAAPALCTYEVHAAAPPPPTLATACPEAVAFRADALRTVQPLIGGDQHASVASLLDRVCELLLHHGWRHVAVPGVALRWSPDQGDIRPVGGWTNAARRSIVGPANTGLEAHRAWADASLRGLRVVVDGACLTDQPFTGTQHVVVEVARWLASERPAATVMLAVPAAQLASVTRRMSGTAVAVCERTTQVDADVVYRPYQMLYARELPFVQQVGRRRVIGQLDMIGFSNPSYHPSDQLFFFARNLQRHLMRTMDGVTFISEFGRDSAFAECPDLEPDRLHVVSCGADPEPQTGRLADHRTLDPSAGILVCLSSTFWHKHRAHAISTFASLVERTGYGGSLVIGGPEPYFGRSTEAEDDVLAALPAGVRDRVHRWGHIDDAEKWWLLRHADVVLYPSIVEGFGLVPFEAAAVDTPCLAHDSTAPGELLRDTPALVDSWEPAAWAARAHELIRDTELARSNVAGVSEAARRHTWQRCADLTWLAIDHAVARPCRAPAAEDGHLLTRIAPRRRFAGGSSLRFDIARGVPAVRRRVVGRLNRSRGSS